MKAELRVTEQGLCIYANGKALLTGITGYLEYPGNHYNILKYECMGYWTVSGNTAVSDSMTLELIPYREGFLVRSTLTNPGGDIENPGEFTAFSGNLTRTIERALVNRYVWANGNRVCEMQSQIETVRPVFNAVYDSADNTAFETAQDDCFVFGAASYLKYCSGVTFTREGHLTAHCRLEAHPVKHGASIVSEYFYLAPCRECVSGLKEFARTVAALANVSPSTRENPTGFCTWYYYGSKITPDVLRQNMAVLDEHRENLPIRYIQIDDGWFDCWGSWNAKNEVFSNMKALADEIRSHGYLPGLWLAPFGCDPAAPIYAAHPDWFVHKPNGEIWNQPSLDFTHPETRAYISDIFRRISHDWGYRYIKIDIITGTLAPGIHHDPDATALENYRLGLKTIRRALTPDTFLLGCTAPLAAACGLVDGMRISCDIFERWQSLCDVFNAVLKRYYYHRTYFLCDADCLIIRKGENEDEECFRPCTRTDEEIKTYLTAMAASGGVLMLSDKLPNLSPHQLTLISKLFPVTQDPADPLDLMDSYIPGVLDFGVRVQTRTVALINWGDAGRELSVETVPSLVREFWSGECFVFTDGTFSAWVEPHCAKVFAFTPMCDAAVIGSSASIVMQSEWMWDGETITGSRLKVDEYIYVAAKHPVRSTEGCVTTLLEESGGYRFYEIALTENRYTLHF